MTRDANRAHWLSLAHAGRARRGHREPDPPDVFYQHAAELDWMNGLSEPLTTIERERRDHLRQARESGSIADEGEVWGGHWKQVIGKRKKGQADAR